LIELLSLILILNPFCNHLAEKKLEEKFLYLKRYNEGCMLDEGVDKGDGDYVHREGYTNADIGDVDGSIPLSKYNSIGFCFKNDYEKFKRSFTKFKNGFGGSRAYEEFVEWLSPISHERISNCMSRFLAGDCEFNHRVATPLFCGDRLCVVDENRYAMRLAFDAFELFLAVEAAYGAPLEIFHMVLTLPKEVVSSFEYGFRPSESVLFEITRDGKTFVVTERVLELALKMVGAKRVLKETYHAVLRERDRIFDLLFRTSSEFFYEDFLRYYELALEVARGEVLDEVKLPWDGWDAINLFHEVVRRTVEAFFTILFGRDVIPAYVSAYASWGDELNLNPHIHVIGLNLVFEEPEYVDGWDGELFKKVRVPGSFATRHLFCSDLNILREIYKANLENTFGVKIDGCVDVFYSYLYLREEGKIIKLLKYLLRSPVLDVVEQLGDVEQLSEEQMVMLKRHVDIPYKFKRIRWHGWLADGVKNKYLKLLGLRTLTEEERADEMREVREGLEVRCPIHGVRVDLNYQVDFEDLAERDVIIRPISVRVPKVALWKPIYKQSKFYNFLVPGPPDEKC
jgi:hypothetical protein